MQPYNHATRLLETESRWPLPGSEGEDRVAGERIVGGGDCEAVTQTSTGPGGSYARLEENGHTLTRFHQEFFARMPTPDEVRLLQLPSGTPVMDVLRVAYGEDGPLEVYTAVVNAVTIIFTEDFDAPD